MPASGLRCGLAVGALLWAVAAVVPARAQERDFDGVVIRPTRIAEGLYMLTGAGGNMAVSAGRDGVVLIDDQFAPLTPRITAALREISEQPLRFVINTHWHGDHTGGNENLGKAGAVVVAHANVRVRMSREQLQTLRGRTTPASPPGALPIVTFTESVTFHLNGETIDVVHLPPAHTDGDSIVRFVTADAIHAGDLLFNGIYPYIDVDSGGSIDGVIAAQAKILELAGPDTVIIPGHGPVSDRSGLEAARAMLATVRDRVRAGMTRGLTLQELAAEKPLADLDEKWGGGFMKPAQFLAVVYADLSRPR